MNFSNDVVTRPLNVKGTELVEGGKELMILFTYVPTYLYTLSGSLRVQEGGGVFRIKGCMPDTKVGLSMDDVCTLEPRMRTK